MRTSTKVLAIAVAIALPAVLAPACGDDTGTPPGNTGGSGGSSGSGGSGGTGGSGGMSGSGGSGGTGGMSGTGGSAGVGTGGAGGTGGTGGAPGVQCGAGGNVMTCNTGQVCCVTGFSAMCTNTCTTGGIACDGPEDCSGGKCCGTFTAGSAMAACTNDAMCPQGQQQICHLPSDCPSSAALCCKITQISATSGFCSATPIQFAQCN